MTDTTTLTNFLGIPVDGEIIRHENQKDQRPIEDLQPLLRAVLDDDQVVEFGWRQYTPYFNDGDACEFGVDTPWFRLVGDEYEHEVDQHPKLAVRRWDRSRYVDVQLDEDSLARRERCRALSSAIEGGEFEHVLLNAFGDHARVKVRRDGIQVEFYEHD